MEEMNAQGLTFDDWCDRAGAFIIMDGNAAKDLRQAWQRGDDPQKWVLKKYLLSSGDMT